MESVNLAITMVVILKDFSNLDSKMDMVLSFIKGILNSNE